MNSCPVCDKPMDYDKKPYMVDCGTWASPFRLELCCEPCAIWAMVVLGFRRLELKLPELSWIASNLKVGP